VSAGPSADERRAAPVSDLVSDLDNEARRVDEARWLASRFAPSAGRARLAALYAWNHEIARVRETVSDPLVGEIRLAWWREAIGEIYEAPERARRHPVVLALADAIAPPAPRPPRALFEALIDARARDLDPRRFADLDEISLYVEATAGGLAKLAARLLVGAGEIAPATDAGLGAAGRSWGLAGLARAFPRHAATGWIAVPDAPSAAEIARMLAARDAVAVRAFTRPLVDAARSAFGEARATLAGAPPALWPAFGYLALLPSQLRALATADPFVLAQRGPGVLDRVRLVLAAARGGV
jgi:phytoene synthase